MRARGYWNPAGRAGRHERSVLIALYRQVLTDPEEVSLIGVLAGEHPGGHGVSRGHRRRAVAGPPGAVEEREGVGLSPAADHAPGDETTIGAHEVQPLEEGE